MKSGLDDQMPSTLAPIFSEPQDCSTSAKRFLVLNRQVGRRVSSSKVAFL
jgi:hypothetical protein